MSECTSTKLSVTLHGKKSMKKESKRKKEKILRQRDDNDEISLTEPKLHWTQRRKNSKVCRFYRVKFYNCNYWDLRRSSLKVATELPCQLSGHFAASEPVFLCISRAAVTIKSSYIKILSTVDTGSLLDLFLSGSRQILQQVHR